MNTKFFLLVLLALLASHHLRADENNKVASKLESATVFFKGAELSHKASATLVKGENRLEVTDVSPNIDLNSLIIKASNGAIITSYSHSVDYLNKQEMTAGQKKMTDSIAFYKKQIRSNEVKLQTTESLIELLNANKSIGGAQNGLSVAELVKMMDYYQGKSTQLENEKSGYEDDNARFEERINVLQNQVNQDITKNTQKTGVLALEITAAMPTTTSLTISYYTTAASWNPFYDINIENTTQPIKIASKARVRQTTGLDWKRVKLALSTSAPSTGKVAPLFNTWFLDFKQNNIQSQLAGRMSGVSVQNSYAYKEQVAEMPVADQASSKIMIRGSSSPINTQPLYIVNGLPADANVVSDLDASMIENVEVLKDASVTAIYGSRGGNGVILITTKSSMDSFVAQNDNDLNMTYNIDIPYTIDGNGKAVSIDLKTYTLDADFKYYCAPKLDPQTYLLAEISDWQKLGLLNGKANVTYDGTYIGETTIDTESTRNKLTLTLGADDRIVVKREKLQDYSSKKMLGSSIKQEIMYKITVRNNQNRTIKMVLKDQYPISSQKDIEVELMKDNTAPTFNNEAVGVYSWELDMKPAESKEFKLGYSVKYPKNSVINL